MIAIRTAACSTTKAALKRAALQARVSKGSGPRLSTVSTGTEQKSSDLGVYAAGFVAGLCMYGAGRYVSQQNMQGVPQGGKIDYSSQEFRDKSMNQGMIEACAGALEWGGIAWSALAVAQILENRFSKNPFLALIGPPRIALLVTGSACAGFAIRGEERLIDSARKPLLEKGEGH